MLRQGMHSESVRKLQTQLGELGYLDNVGTPDGKFGPTTAKAVQSFQHDHHLPEVGRAGPATQQAIQAGLAPLAEHNSGPLPAVPAMSSLTVAPSIDATCTWRIGRGQNDHAQADDGMDHRPLLLSRHSMAAQQTAAACKSSRR